MMVKCITSNSTTRHWLIEGEWVAYLSLFTFSPGLHLGTLTGIHPPLWLSRCQDLEDLPHLWQDHCKKFEQCPVQD